MGKVLQQKKIPPTNIYVRISHSVLCPALESITRRVNLLTAQTLFGNHEDLRCTYAGPPMALLTHNVDRAIWTLGRGGVRKSLFSSLIGTGLRANHAYLDIGVLYQDDEHVTKTVPNLAHYIVWATQEAT